METVQQNDRFKLFSSKFPSNIYSILFVKNPNIRGWIVGMDLAFDKNASSFRRFFKEC